jgi:hypothetical protein
MFFFLLLFSTMRGCAPRVARGGRNSGRSFLWGFDPIPASKSRRVIGPLGQQRTIPPSFAPLIEQREALVLVAAIIVGSGPGAWIGTRSI